MSDRTDIQIEEAIKEKASQMLNGNHKNMGDALGIQFQKLSRTEMIAEMPVNDNTVQPFGILHGGASVALAETLASVGAWLNLQDDSKTAVGLEINANHIKAVRKGNKVIGIAKPIHRGAQTQVWETRIETESGKLVCISRCTLAIIQTRR
ncbi:hotdog fold thioesterase [Rhodohalobacter halophilus]|uniref:hotdog fold thioesterase n=1 Tax=Rhodohalobacter halophilus TaxID=1812810 RepID=UPI000AE1850D|nr:hotdog fold thioesterase [Rhodohalobacter halophilus]